MFRELKKGRGESSSPHLRLAFQKIPKTELTAQFCDPKHLTKWGIFTVAPPLSRQTYHIVTDNDDVTCLLVGPITLQQVIAPNNPIPCSLAVPPPLPEYAVEVTPC